MGEPPYGHARLIIGYEPDGTLIWRNTWGDWHVVDDEPKDIGNPRFIELNAEELATHRAKAAGYSGSDNPDAWANFREAEAWGVKPSIGALIRMGDKYRRAQNIIRNPANEQVGESIHDTLMDLSNYAKIALCLLEEEQNAILERLHYPQGTVDIEPSGVEGWRYDSLSEVTEEDHPYGESCVPLFPHSHRDGKIKWARQVSR